MVKLAGEMLLCTPTTYFNEVTREYVNRRNILVEGLNKIEGVIYSKPKGAFYNCSTTCR